MPEVVDSEWGINTENINLPNIPNEITEPVRIESVVSRISRDSSIITYLKDLYDNTCQMCGFKLTLNSETSYSEGAHVRPLSEGGSDTIDNVLMFIPIEPALLTLYNEANKLIEESWNKKIIIVGPSTLPFLLKAVENMWRVDKQSKTIKDIASAASDIYDKTVSVYESFIKANQSLDLAKTKMDEARQRLQEGSGSLTKKVEKMKKLGRLSTKKQLPDSDDDVIG